MSTSNGKIRLGIIGANIHLGWAPRSHLPAVVASPEFELTAVCTTRMESAEESAKAFGAKMAFDNYQDLDRPSRILTRWPWCCGCRRTMNPLWRR